MSASPATGGSGTGVSVAVDASSELRDAIAAILLSLTQTTSTVQQTTKEVTRVQSVKGFDGRSGGGSELVVSTERGHFMVALSGLPLCELFGADAFASHTGATQNLRCRFVHDRAKIAYIDECVKAYDALKTTRPIDGVLCTEYRLASDEEYKGASLDFIQKRVKELSDAEASEVHALLTEKKLKPGSKRLETVVPAVQVLFTTAHGRVKAPSGGYVRKTWGKKP